MTAYINSQFGYCPPVWMMHNKTVNKNINRIQERACRIIPQDDTSTFEELHNKDNSVKIHTKNLQLLANLVPRAIFKN